MNETILLAEYDFIRDGWANPVEGEYPGGVRRETLLPYVPRMNEASEEQQAALATAVIYGMQKKPWLKP